MSALPLTITDAARALRAGSITSVELTEASIARADALDERLGTYITRMDEVALEAARQADADFAAGIDRGPLQGIPLGVKDIIATKDAPTTAQSLVLEPAWGAGRDAVVVQRLREAGAVITGKAATLEFAIGIADPEKPFPVHRNPWDTDRWPGGSSAGTGSGVAAGLFLGGLGTDTGGSIRIPAAYCGISGLKQTYGRVPKSGTAPLGYSLDHIGPTARSAANCAAILQVIAGYDASDLTCADVPVDDYSAAVDPSTGGSLEGLTVGVERAHHLGHEHAETEAIEAFERAVTVLQEAGATVVEVAIPHYDEASFADVAIMMVEAASYHMMDFRTRWTDYGRQTRKALSWAFKLSAADYVQAQRVRSLAVRELAGLMQSLDVIVHPTTLAGAPTLAETDIGEWGAWPLFTSYGNTVGYPVLSVPMGFSCGLPVGMSIIGRPFEEATVLRVGDAYQRITNWHLRTPPLLAEVEA